MQCHKCHKSHWKTKQPLGPWWLAQRVLGSISRNINRQIKLIKYNESYDQPKRHFYFFYLPWFKYMLHTIFYSDKAFTSYQT